MSRRLIVLAGLAAAGCSTPPPALHGEAATPAVWVAAADPSVAQATRPAGSDPASREWWQRFGDPVLDALIATVDTDNFDLQRARARVVEARAARGIATARLLPEVNARATAARSSAGRIGFDNPVSYFEAAFDASWEIDVFGGNARQADAAAAQAESAAESAADVRLTLRAEVARNYVELRAAQERLRLTLDTLTTRRDTAALVRALHTAGLRSELDLAQAESQTLALEAGIPALRTAVVAPARRLDTLLGRMPGSAVSALHVDAPLPVPAAGPVLDEPAAVIARRPDLRRAERDLAIAGALAAAAVADFYPKFNLGSLVGYRDVAAGPAGLIWTLAASLAVPVYNAGRLNAQAEAANARAQQAHLAYRQAVLAALEEVEVALTRYLNTRRNVAALDALIDSERRRLALAEERYRHGITPFSDVLDAQRALYAAQIERVGAVAKLSAGYIVVSKALGG